MSDNQVLFTFTADTTKLLNAIKDNVAAIENLKKYTVSYNQTNNTLNSQTIETAKSFNIANEIIKKSSTEIQNNVAELKKQSLAYSENIIKLKDNIKAYQDDIDMQVKYNNEIKNKLKNLNEESKLLGKITQDNVQEKAEIASKIKVLKDEQETVNKNISILKETQKITKDNLFLINQSKSAISNNIKYLQLQDQEVKKVTQNTKDQTKALQTNITALAQHKETLNNNTNHTENFRNTIWELVYALRGMEQGLNLIIGTPFTAYSREFDKNMYNMNSIALESVQNFAMLREQLIQISKDNNYSGLNQLSESLYQAYSAGFKLQGALELVREADKGALAGLARTEDVLKALVTVLHAYNMTADQASRINNIFLNTVQEGVITMPELTRTIGQAVTIAPELGIAFEDIAGAFVAMTRQGINAHETVTSINGVLKTFLDPSKEASTYAKELGINLSASAFQGRSFGQVIKEIAQKADIDVIGKIFGNVRGLKGFFKLAKDEGDKFIQFENDMKDNTDAVAKAAEEQRKSFDQTMTRLKNTFEISMNDIGTLAQQIFTPVLKFFTELLRLFNETPSSIKMLMGGLTILGGTLTGITIGLAGAVSGLKALGIQIGVETTGISLMSGAMKGLIANVGLLGTTLTGVEAGIGAFAIGAGAIGAIGAGVGALGYTAYQGYKAYDDNKEFEKRVEKISKSEKKAKEIADKYKSQDSPLTYLEKMEYARALIQSDATNKANKELALRLMASAKAEIDNEKHIQLKKQKLNLETVEKNKKTREEYTNKQKEIDDLIDQATMSDSKFKIKKVTREYDEKIKLATDFSNLMINTTKKDRDKALEEASSLEIAKQKEITKLKQEGYEKELEKRQAHLKKLSDLEFKKQDYDNKLKFENFQEKGANLGLAKGTLSDDEFEIKLNSINKARKKIYDDIANNKKLTPDIRESARINSLELEISIENKLSQASKNRIEEEVKHYQTKTKLIQEEAKLSNELVQDTNAKLIKANQERIDQINLELNTKRLNKKEAQALIDEEIQLLMGSAALSKSNQDEEFKNIQEKAYRELDLEKFKQDQLYSLGLEGLASRLDAENKDLDQRLILKQNEINYEGDLIKKQKLQAELEKMVIERQNKPLSDEIKLRDEALTLETKKYNLEISHIDNLSQLKQISERQALQDKISKSEAFDTYLRSKAPKNEYNKDGSKNKDFEKTNEQIQANLVNQFNLRYQLHQKELAFDKEIFDNKLNLINKLNSAVGKLGADLQNNPSTNILGGLINDTSGIIGKGTDVFSKVKDYSKQYQDLNSTRSTKQKFFNLDTDEQKLVKFKMTSDLTTLGINELFNSINSGVKAFENFGTEAQKTDIILKLFGNDSKELKDNNSDLVNSYLEFTKVLPVVGDLLYKIDRSITDGLGLTTSDKRKKELQDISTSEFELAKARISTQENSTKNKIVLLDLEFTKEKENLVKNFSTEEQYKNDLERLELEHQNKLAEISRQGTQELLDINLQYNQSLMGIQKSSFENQKKVLQQEASQKLLNIFLSAPSTNDTQAWEEFNKKVLTVVNNLTTATKELENTQTQTTRDIKYNLNKSILDLQADSTNKTITLAKLERDNKLAILEDEKAKGLTINQDYADKKLTIENEYLASLNKAYEDNGSKIQSLNEKNYNEEIKAFEALNGNKTSKLKSELQKQFDIINDYEQKKQDLIDSRNQDQELKLKRNQQFKADLLAKQQQLSGNGAFFSSNQTAFEIGNGLSSGNTTLQNRADMDYSLGIISYAQMSQQKTDLALQKYVYYQQQLALYQDPKKREEINAKLQDAQKIYYQYIFDSEQEKLDIEKKNADAKEQTLKDELAKREKNEADFITELDNKYKDSAGLYRDSFVQASRDWIAIAKAEGIKALGVDVYKTIMGAGNNIAQNAKQAQGVQVGNATTNDKLPNETVDQYINRIKLQDAQAEKARLSTTSNSFNPYATTTSTPINSFNPYAPVSSSTSKPTITKVALLDRIRNNGFFGASEYENLFDKPLDVIIARAKELGIPAYAKGGVTKGLSLVGEIPEAYFNYPQMSRMYDYMTKGMYQNTINNSNPVNVNLVSNISIGNVSNSNKSDIINLVSKEFNSLKNSLTNSIYKK